MLSLNNVDLTTYQPYLTKSESDFAKALKSYQYIIDDRHDIHNELTRLRLCHQDKKLKIDFLKIELLIATDECIISNDKCESLIKERNMLVANNIRLNVAIDGLHNTMDTIELNNHIT